MGVSDATQNGQVTFSFKFQVSSFKHMNMVRSFEDLVVFNDCQGIGRLLFSLITSIRNSEIAGMKYRYS